jgi:hypothetical protein
MPFIPANCDKPPTLYTILESIVNYGKEEKTKIKDLAKEGRSTIFDFDYPLSEKVNKEDFECIILNHYLRRRIGFETVTAFRIALYSKLNEIMPLYNKMFDAIGNWNIFNDGEKTTRYGTDNRETNVNSNTENTLSNESTTTSDRRYSDTPQNKINNVKEGAYVTDYNFDTNKDNSQSTGNSKNNMVTNDDNVYNETIEKTMSNKIEILKEYQENIKSVYSMIFDELDVLFYGLV